MLKRQWQWALMAAVSLWERELIMATTAQVCTSNLSTAVNYSLVTQQLLVRYCPFHIIVTCCNLPCHAASPYLHRVIQSGLIKLPILCNHCYCIDDAWFLAILHLPRAHCVWDRAEYMWRTPPHASNACFAATFFQLPGIGSTAGTEENRKYSNIGIAS